MSLLILALGNDLLGDDGVGLLAGDNLMPYTSKDVKVTKSSLSGLYLVDLIEGFDDLLVVDSVIGDNPGKVVMLETRDIGPKIVPSAHHAGLSEAIEISRQVGMRMPKRVAIVGIQIADSQVLGTDVSPKVMKGVPSLIEKVIDIACKWGYEMKPHGSSQRRRKSKRKTSKVR